MLLTNREFEVLVSKKIDEIIEDEIEKSKKIIDFIPPHLEYFKKLSITNGKKIRAYLIYIGYNLFQQSDDIPEELLELTAAMEIFHTAILIHDDIMDNSRIRRGIPTFHNYEESILNDTHMALSSAMCFGDFGFFLAQHIIASNPTFPHETIIEMLKIFNRISINLAYGQVYDLLANIKNSENITLEKNIEICNLKTSIYTFLLPLQLGIIASGSGKDITTINDYAYNTGIIFQLTDDIIDIFSSSEKTGKAECGDLREGKVNAIIKMTLDTTKEKDHQYILDILQGNRKDFSPEKVREIIVRNKVLKVINKDIDIFSKKAYDALDNIEANPIAKEILKNITNSLKTRDK